MADSIAADELRLLIERIERLTEEKKAAAEDINDVYKEAKDRGYAVQIMKEIVKLRAMDDHERQERDALLDLYRNAVGLPFNETPLGAAVQNFRDSMERTGASKVTMQVAGEEPVTVYERQAAE